MSYQVYTAEYVGVPNHVALYVETAPGRGNIYTVVGDILNGMSYESKAEVDPEQSLEYAPGSKICLGSIPASHLPRLEAICAQHPPPGPQLRLNGRRLDPTKSVRRCAEWVQEVKERIVEEGLFV